MNETTSRTPGSSSTTRIELTRPPPRVRAQDDPTARRVLHRVVREIPQRLLEQIAVDRRHEPRRAVDRDWHTLSRKRPIRHLLQEPGERDRLDARPFLPRVRPREREQR